MSFKKYPSWMETSGHIPLFGIVMIKPNILNGKFIPGYIYVESKNQMYVISLNEYNKIKDSCDINTYVWFDNVYQVKLCSFHIYIMFLYYIILILSVYMYSFLCINFLFECFWFNILYGVYPCTICDVLCFGLI